MGLMMFVFSGHQFVELQLRHFYQLFEMAPMIRFSFRITMWFCRRTIYRHHRVAETCPITYRRSSGNICQPAAGGFCPIATGLYYTVYQLGSAGQPRSKPFWGRISVLVPARRLALVSACSPLYLVGNQIVAFIVAFRFFLYWGFFLSRLPVFCGQGRRCGADVRHRLSLQFHKPRG